MARQPKIKRAGKIKGFARFGLLASEMDLLDKAAYLEERSRSDFCRIASLQRARVVISQDDQLNIVPIISDVLRREQEGSPNLPFDE